MKKWEEYKFKIEAYTPDTLPMERCASYMKQLAEMLGEFQYVHFVRLENGSSTMVHKVDIEAVPRVKERTAAVKQGKGTVVEMSAYHHINKMLQEDNGTGVLLEDNNVEIIRFPGKELEKLKLSSIQQAGEIDGEVIRVGGSKEIVPILLEVEGKDISGCHARRDVAKDLAKNLFEPVRLYGDGRWDRNIDGEWDLVYFFVHRFDVLKEISLSSTVLALRSLKGEWGKDSLHEILRNREEEDQ